MVRINKIVFENGSVIEPIREVKNTIRSSVRYISLDDIIISMFPDNPMELCGLNNVKVDYIIFSNNIDNANKKMDEILNNIDFNDILKVIHDKCNYEIHLKNGTKYMWLKVNDYLRGYRCKNAIIDKELSLEQIQKYILPIAIYCSKNNVELF